MTQSDSTGSDRPGGATLRRRVPCEVHAHGRVHKGVATELAPHEVFVELTGSSLPRRGSDVQLRLSEAAEIDGLELRGIVAQEKGGSLGGRGMPRGISVRIVEAPPEFHALFATASAEVTEVTEVEVLVELGPGAPGSSPLVAAESAHADADWPAPRPAPPPAGADFIDEQDLVRADAGPSPTDRAGWRSEADLPASRADRATPPARRVPPKDETDAEPHEADAAEARSATADQGATPATADEASSSAASPSAGPASATRPANAIVIYDGNTLQDVYDLLEEMGARPVRARLSGPTRFSGWTKPPRMIVVDAQDALGVEIPPDLIHDGVIRIAVASSASATIGAMLRSQGFHYLVRRPVHRGALEALLRHAMHRGAERRTLSRAPLGIDARLRAGRWRWPKPCTVLELSPIGCRLATRQNVPLLTIVQLRIRRAISGTRAISIRGRVVRRRRDEETGEWVLALRFIEMPPEQRGRLDGLLERTAIGPTAELTDGPLRRAGLWLDGLGHGEAPALRGAPAARSDPEADARSREVLLERRHVSRSKLEGEVVALDETRSQVTAVLTGRDLSTLGMRIEPHPEISVGRRLVLALYDSVGRGTIELAAEVVRDDGELGMGLRFVDMDAESAARLDQLVESLPVVESLGRGRPVVMARIDPDSDFEPLDLTGAVAGEPGVAPDDTDLMRISDSPPAPDAEAPRPKSAPPARAAAAPRAPEPESERRNRRARRNRRRARRG